jgi:hypothetical protein
MVMPDIIFLKAPPFEVSVYNIFLVFHFFRGATHTHTHNHTHTHFMIIILFHKQFDPIMTFSATADKTN